MDQTLTFSPPLRRVAVTGRGAITSLGVQPEAIWHGLHSGRKPVLTHVGEGFHAALINDFDPAAYFRMPKNLKLTDRKTRLAVAAAALAVADAGLSTESAANEDLGVLLGTGSIDLILEDLARAVGPDPTARAVSDIPHFAARVSSDLNPLWLLLGLPNMVSAQVSIQLQASGPNSTLMTDWIGGLQAIGEAALWIRNGEADVVVAGGADSSVSMMDLIGFEQAGLFEAAGTTAGEPFIPAEGAGIVVLEEYHHALRRGAPVYGTIEGYSTVAFEETDGGAGTLLRSLESALGESGWNWDQIGAFSYSLAVGRISRQRVMEDLARAAAASPHARWFHFQETLGHSLAAAGAIDLILLMMNLERDSPPSRALCCSVGLSRQACSLALSIAGAERS